MLYYLTVAATYVASGADTSQRIEEELNKVTTTLSSSDAEIVNNIKETLKRFQKFLINFELITIQLVVISSYYAPCAWSLYLFLNHLILLCFRGKCL